MNKTTLGVLRDPVSVFTRPPLIWSWVQVPSNVPLTTTDLMALVPEVSGALMSSDPGSPFLMSLSGLQNLSQYGSPNSCN